MTSSSQTTLPESYDTFRQEQANYTYYTTEVNLQELQKDARGKKDRASVDAPKQADKKVKKPRVILSELPTLKLTNPNEKSVQNTENKDQITVVNKQIETTAPTLVNTEVGKSLRLSSEQLDLSSQDVRSETQLQHTLGSLENHLEKALSGNEESSKSDKRQVYGMYSELLEFYNSSNKGTNQLTMAAISKQNVEQNSLAGAEKTLDSAKATLDQAASKLKEVIDPSHKTLFHRLLMKIVGALVGVIVAAIITATVSVVTAGSGSAAGAAAGAAADGAVDGAVAGADAGAEAAAESGVKAALKKVAKVLLSKVLPVAGGAMGGLKVPMTLQAHNDSQTMIDGSALQGKGNVENSRGQVNVKIAAANQASTASELRNVQSFENTSNTMIMKTMQSESQVYKV